MKIQLDFSLTHPAILALLTFALSGVTSALEVTTTSDEVNMPGSSRISLRDAIRDAVSGDTITFESELSGGTIQLVEQILIAKNLTIVADTLPSGITIDGGNESRIFEIAAGSLDVEVRGMTFTAGLANTSDNYPDNGGGAILVGQGANCSVVSCLFTGNSGTQFGGGDF